MKYTKHIQVEVPRNKVIKLVSANVYISINKGNANITASCVGNKHEHEITDIVYEIGSRFDHVDLDTIIHTVSDLIRKEYEIIELFIDNEWRPV
jgi:hypothetical protein